MSKEHTIIPTAQRQWHEGIYENTEMCYLWEEASSERRAFLLKMKPGSVIPMHDHPQREIAILLEGDMIMDDGQVMYAGDFLTAGHGEPHEVTTKTGCIMFLYIDYDVETRQIVNRE